MSQVDDVVRELATRRLGEPISAMARFRAAGPTSNPMNVFVAAEFLHRRRRAHLPNPAYLAVTKTAVKVFSARFGSEIRLIGPLETWPRDQIKARRVAGHRDRVVFEGVPDRENAELEVEAVERGIESDNVIDLVCDTSS